MQIAPQISAPSAAPALGNLGEVHDSAVRVPFRVSFVHSKKGRSAVDQLAQNQDNIIHLTGVGRLSRNRRCNLVNDALDPGLPPDNSKRWTPRRKAAVVLALRNEIISVWDVCERYSLSAEEIAHWERDLDQYGVPGLRSTRVQIYRKTAKPK